MDGTASDTNRKLVFPLAWQYRIVAEAGIPGLEDALKAVFAAAGIPNAEVMPSQSSSSGKYRSYTIRTEFQSEAQMNALDTALGRVPGVKFVL